MSVVSNASPIIHLARVGQLELLRQLYGEILRSGRSPTLQKSRRLKSALSRFVTNYGLKSIAWATFIALSSDR